MNPDPLAALWNSSANRPGSTAGAQLAAQFVSRLRSRRRFQACWLTCTFVLLAGTTALAVTHLARHGLEALRGQSSLLPLIVLPWSAAIYFLRAFLHGRAVTGASVHPLRAVLVAAQVSNASARRHLRLVGALFATMVPVAALAVWQLHAAGKTPGNQVWSMTFAFGLVFALGAFGLATRYRRQLLPEQRTIEARLRELDAPAAG